MLCRLQVPPPSPLICRLLSAEISGFADPGAYILQAPDCAILFELHLTSMYSHSLGLNFQEEEKDKLRCFHTEVLTENQSMDKLPKDAVIIQFMEASDDVPVPVLAASDIAELHLEAQVHLRE